MSVADGYGAVGAEKLPTVSLMQGSHLYVTLPSYYPYAHTSVALSARRCSRRTLMNVRKLPSDFIGLSKVMPPLSRRGFMTNSAAAAAGYTLAAGPVRAD